MPTRPRLGDSQYRHFITFAVVNWIDAVKQPSVQRPGCKWLKILSTGKRPHHQWLVIMSNHVHLIARSNPDFQLAIYCVTKRSLQVKRLKKLPS